MKRTVNFISDHCILAVAISVIESVLNVLMLLSFHYNIFAFASIFMFGLCLFYIFGYSFGHTNFMRGDLIWKRLKREGKTQEYREEALHAAARAFIPGNIVFAAAVVVCVLSLALNTRMNCNGVA